VDGTGRAEFAIYLWITAVQTFFAHIDVMLETGITGLSIRVIEAMFHILIFSGEMVLNPASVNFAAHKQSF
jgi:hypothetical protein